MKKMLCIIVMAMIMEYGVQHGFAQEIGCVEVLSKKEYEHVTDIEELLGLAEISIYSGDNSNIDVNFNEDIGEVKIEQLISETYLSDGTIAREYSLSTISLYENLGTRGVEQLSLKKTWGVYDMACSITAYFTSYYGASTGIVVNSFSFQYSKGGSSSITMSSVQLYSHGAHNVANEEVIDRYATYNNPSPGMIYLISTDDSRLYSSSPVSDIWGGAKVVFSNGYSYDGSALQITAAEMEKVG